MTELTGKAVGWALKILLTAVMGFNTIQGMITPAIDSLKNTAFTRAARMLPGVGNAAGGVADVLLGSAVLLKNGVGASAVLVLALLCLGPLVQLGVLTLLLKGTAALIQPVCDKRFSGCVSGAGEGVRLLFQAVFTVTVLFVVTIVVVTVSVRGVGRLGSSLKAFIYGWIRDIAFYTILMTVILHLLPEESQKKYVRFFMGVVLMLVVLSPLLSVAGLSGTLDSIYAEQTYDEELQNFTRRQAELEADYAREIEKRKQELTGDGTENPADGEEEQGGSSDIKVEIVLDE